MHVKTPPSEKGMCSISNKYRKKMCETISILKINSLKPRQVRYYDIFVANFEQKFQY